MSFPAYRPIQTTNTFKTANIGTCSRKSENALPVTQDGQVLSGTIDHSQSISTGVSKSDNHIGTSHPPALAHAKPRTPATATTPHTQATQRGGGTGKISAPKKRPQKEIHRPFKGHGKAKETVPVPLHPSCHENSRKKCADPNCAQYSTSAEQL